MKVITSNSFALKQKYNGKTQQGLKDVEPEYFGMGKNWYGGNLFKCSILQDTSIVLMINKDRKTIDVGYIEGRENEVPEEDCSYFGIELAEEEEIEQELPLITGEEPKKPVIQRRKPSRSRTKK